MRLLITGVDATLLFSPSRLPPQDTTEWLLEYPSKSLLSSHSGNGIPSMLGSAQNMFHLLLAGKGKT